MSARPWFRFYAGDWRSDPALRSCSAGARGLWIEMLALMHEASPRGHLSLPNGDMIEAGALPAMTGLPAPDVRKLLAELTRAGVFSTTPEGVIFSRKMVRDTAKDAKQSEHGKSGGNPQLVRTSESEALTQALRQEPPSLKASLIPHGNGSGPIQWREPKGRSLATGESTSKDSPFLPHDDAEGAA